MEHTGYNSTVLPIGSGEAARFKYQGQERNDELDLNWDSFKWRNYDYAIGRFFNIDPLAEKYAYQSPYNFAENKVVRFNELEGLEITLNKFDKISYENKQEFHSTATTVANAVISGANMLIGIFNYAGELDRADNEGGGFLTGSIDKLRSDATSVYNGVSDYVSNTSGAQFAKDVVSTATDINTVEDFAGALLVGQAFKLPNKLGGSAVNNPVPKKLSRILPADIETSMLGITEDVFVTAAEDISGMNASQIAKRLTIPESESGFQVISFETPSSGISSPINRTNPGFVGRGKTAGGAREFTLPNQEIPAGATKTVIK